MYTSRCIKEFYWASKSRTFVPGDVVVGEYKELLPLEQARVIAIDRQEEAAVEADRENAASRTQRVRGR